MFFIKDIKYNDRSIDKLLALFNFLIYATFRLKIITKRLRGAFKSVSRLFIQLKQIINFGDVGQLFEVENLRNFNILFKN